MSNQIRRNRIRNVLYSVKSNLNSKYEEVLHDNLKYAKNLRKFEIFVINSHFLGAKTFLDYTTGNQSTKEVKIS